MALLNGISEPFLLREFRRWVVLSCLLFAGVTLLVKNLPEHVGENTCEATKFNVYTEDVSRRQDVVDERWRVERDNFGVI